MPDINKAEGHNLLYPNDGRWLLVIYSGSTILFSIICFF